MKLLFIPRYIVPENRDAIAVTVLIPRKILLEAKPDYTTYGGLPLETLVKILENSEYMPDPVTYAEG